MVSTGGRAGFTAFLSTNQEVCFICMHGHTSFLIRCCGRSLFIGRGICRRSRLEYQSMLYLNKIIVQSDYFISLFLEKETILSTERLSRKMSSYRGISHWLGSDSNPSLSRATSVNILQLRSEIPSLH